ncbi:Thioredoxin domain-containing protein [Psidium guajava]|nr:Thioredoxin domain-containing protein [Psidium guajava]
MSIKANRPNEDTQRRSTTSFVGDNLHEHSSPDQKLKLAGGLPARLYYSGWQSRSGA